MKRVFLILALGLSGNLACNLYCVGLGSADESCFYIGRRPLIPVPMLILSRNPATDDQMFQTMLRAHIELLRLKEKIENNEPLSQFERDDWEDFANGGNLFFKPG